MEGYSNGGYMTRRYDSIRDNGTMAFGRRAAAPGPGYLPSSNFNQTSYPSNGGYGNNYNNFNRMDSLRPGYNNGNPNYGGYSDGRNFSDVSYPASYGGGNGGYNNFNGMGSSYGDNNSSSYGGWPSKASSSSNSSSGKNSLMEKATNVAERAAVQYLSEKTSPVIASTIASAAFPKQNFAVAVPKNGGHGGGDIEPMGLIKEAATRYSNFSASSKKEWR